MDKRSNHYSIISGESVVCLTDSDVEMRLAQMKELYELRFQTLKEVIGSTYNKVLNDNLLKAMQLNPVSSEYVTERIQELFTESLQTDKEIMIQQLSSQYAYIKTVLSKTNELRRSEGEERERLESIMNVDISSLKEENIYLKKEIDILKKENASTIEMLETRCKNIKSNLEEESAQVRKELEDDRKIKEELSNIYSQLDEEHKFLAGKNSELEEKLLESQQKVDQLSSEREEYFREVEVLRSSFTRCEQLERREAILEREIQELNLKYSSVLEERSACIIQFDELQSMNHKLEKSNELLKENNAKEIQKLKQESARSIEKAKNKKNALQKHLEECQNNIRDLESDAKKLKYERESEKIQNQKKLEAWELLVKTTRIECDKKVREIHNQNEAQKEEQEKFTQNKIEEEIQKRESLIQQAIDETRSEMQIEIEELKQKEEQYINQIHMIKLEIDSKYVSKQIYDDLLAEKERVVNKLKEDCQKYLNQWTLSIQTRENQQEQRYSQMLQEQFIKYEKKIEESESSSQQLRNVISQLQEQNQLLKEESEGFKLDVEKCKNAITQFEENSARDVGKLKLKIAKSEQIILNLKQLEHREQQLKAELQDKIISEKQKDIISSRLQENKEELEAQLQATNSKVDSLISQFSTIKSDLLMAQQTIIFKDEILARHVQTIAELKQSHKELQSELLQQIQKKNQNVQPHFINSNDLEKIEKQSEERKHKIEILTLQLDQCLQENRFKDEEINQLKETLMQIQEAREEEYNKFYNKLRRCKEGFELTKVEIQRLKRESIQLLEFIKHQIRVKASEVEMQIKSIANKSKELVKRHSNKNEQIQGRVETLESEGQQILDELTEARREVAIMNDINSLLSQKEQAEAQRQEEVQEKMKEEIQNSYLANQETQKKLDQQIQQTNEWKGKCSEISELAQGEVQRMNQEIEQLQEALRQSQNSFAVSQGNEYEMSETVAKLKGQLSDLIQEREYWRKEGLKNEKHVGEKSEQVKLAEQKYLDLDSKYKAIQQRLKETQKRVNEEYLKIKEKEELLKKKDEKIKELEDKAISIKEDRQREQDKIIREHQKKAKEYEGRGQEFQNLALNYEKIVVEYEEKIRELEYKLEASEGSIMQAGEQARQSLDAVKFKEEKMLYIEERLKEEITKGQEAQKWKQEMDQLKGQIEVFRGESAKLREENEKIREQSQYLREEVWTLRAQAKTREQQQQQSMLHKALINTTSSSKYDNNGGELTKKLEEETEELMRKVKQLKGINQFLITTNLKESSEENLSFQNRKRQGQMQEQINEQKSNSNGFNQKKFALPQPTRQEMVPKRTNNNSEINKQIELEKNSRYFEEEKEEQLNEQSQSHLQIQLAQEEKQSDGFKFQDDSLKNHCEDNEDHFDKELSLNLNSQNKIQFLNWNDNSHDPSFKNIMNNNDNNNNNNNINNNDNSNNNHNINSNNNNSNSNYSKSQNKKQIDHLPMQFNHGSFSSLNNQCNQKHSATYRDQTNKNMTSDINATGSQSERFKKVTGAAESNLKMNNLLQY